MPFTLIVIAAAVIFLFALVATLLGRYKRCPSDLILVVYGKVGSGPDGQRSAKCIHGGAAFIWPVFQDYAFLDLTPIGIEVNLAGALSKQNIRVDVPSKFTVGISTEPGVMENAAERLLGLECHPIRSDHSNLFPIWGLPGLPQVGKQVPFPEYVPKWQAIEKT